MSDAIIHVAGVPDGLIQRCERCGERATFLLMTRK